MQKKSVKNATSKQKSIQQYRKTENKTKKKKNKNTEETIEAICWVNWEKISLKIAYMWKL